MSENPSTSSIVDLVTGRLLIRALDDLHAIAEASSKLPTMVDQLSDGLAASREMTELAKSIVETANASATALVQVTAPLVGAAEQFGRVVERLPSGLARLATGSSRPQQVEAAVPDPEARQASQPRPR
jgi:hypothetical protein